MMNIVVICSQADKEDLAAFLSRGWTGVSVDASDWTDRSIKRREGCIVATFEETPPWSVFVWLILCNSVLDFVFGDVPVPTPKKKSVRPFHQSLRYERERRGWSQARVAALLGVSDTEISRWERGVTRPYPCYREPLCALFHKNAEELGLLEEKEYTTTAS